MTLPTDELDKRIGQIIEWLYDHQYDISEIERTFKDCRIAGLKEAADILAEAPDRAEAYREIRERIRSLSTSSEEK